LLVIGYGAKIRWVAMRVKAENRMVTKDTPISLKNDRKQCLNLGDISVFDLFPLF